MYNMIFRLKVQSTFNEEHGTSEFEKELTEKVNQIYTLIDELSTEDLQFTVDYQKIERW